MQMNGKDRNYRSDAFYKTREMNCVKILITLYLVTEIMATEIVLHLSRENCFSFVSCEIIPDHRRCI